MADEQSTNVDTTDVVDTSVSDDTTTEADDVDLEDIEVDEADIEGSDDDEQQDEEDSESEDESDDTEADDTSEEDSEEQSDDTETTELSDEQKQAQHNKEMYDRRQQEKQARIDRVQQDQAQYLNEAAENGDPLEQAVRQLQITGYNNTVDANTNKLTNGYERALTDFPVLKTTDPAIQAEIDATIDAFQAMNVSIDAYGNPTEVRGDLYATLQAKADSIEKLTGLRVKNQEQSKSKEKSKSLKAPTRAPREAKKDPDLEAFDAEAYS